MRYILLKIVFCTFLLSSNSIIYAYGLNSKYITPDEWSIKENINNGSHSKDTNTMDIGKTTLYYWKGLLVFDTADIPDNSIITGYDAFSISIEGTPPTTTDDIRAMEMKKNPNTTGATDLYNDCKDGTVFDWLAYSSNQTSDTFPANVSGMISCIQDNLESNWAAIGFVGEDN